MVKKNLNLSPVDLKLRHKAIRAKVIGQTIIWIMLIVMYIPILMLIAYSFTAATNVGTWTGFSLKLYSDLFHDEEIMTALANTIILALASASVSVILGTCGAIGTFYSKKKTRAVVETVTQIPVVNAEIVIALSLTVMFVFVGSYLFQGANVFSFWTLLVGHVILSLPFVYLSVKPKLQQMDPALYEAALDLGCTQRKALFKVVLPEIFPGVLSGFLLAITLSLDDFIVTAFTRGAGLLSGEKTIETLSTLVQAKIKKGPIPPAMRALTTILVLVVFLAVVLITIYQNRAHKKKTRKGRESL
jgi:spermidine/putrescine transport system permease protein